MNRVVDVVVTDGFTGNVALKTIEGSARGILGALRQTIDLSRQDQARAACCCAATCCASSTRWTPTSSAAPSSSG